MQVTVLSADFADQIAIRRTHHHDYHEILFVTGGTACVHVNKTKYHVCAGDLVIFSRLEHHAVTEQSWDYGRYVLELSADITSTDWQSYRVISLLFNRPEGFSNVLHVQKEVFAGIFESICREMGKKDTMYPQMLDCLVQQLLIQIYRQLPPSVQIMEQGCFDLVYRIQTRFPTPG